VTDLHLAFRMMGKQPGMSLLAIVALALGIGLTTTMFSIVNGAVLRGLPFENSDRIHAMQRVNYAVPDGPDTSEQATLHDFADWRARQTSFESLAAFQGRLANVVGPDGTPERYRGIWQTPNTFSLLRATPALGRDFRAEEERSGAEPVVIISDKVWRERFDGRPDAVGQPLRINGQVMTVVGVMPPGFAFPVVHDLWAPLTMDLDPARRGQSQRVQVIARLGDAGSLDRASAEFATIASQLAAEYPDTNQSIGVAINSYIESFIGGETVAALFTMLAAVFGVLVIACANVANLVLARAADRTREVAVRTAIGASRGRVIRQMLTEVLVLALIGAGAGLAIADAGITLFNRAIVDTSPPFWIDIRIDSTVLMFVSVVAVMAAVVAGIVPAWRASRTDLAGIMKDEGRSTGIRMGRFSRGLVVAELAVSFGLLVASGLAIQSIVNVANVDFGFPAHDVWAGRVVLPDQDYPDEAKRRQAYDAMLTRVQTVPGVLSAALATDVAPMATPNVIRLPGQTYANEREYPGARGVMITPDYFTVLRAAALEGRLFDTRDHESAEPVAIVNVSFARKFFPNGALGQRFAMARGEHQEWRTVVGVVADLGFGQFTNGTLREGFYVPLAQVPAAAVALVAHVAGAPLAVTTPIRQAVRDVDSNLPISSPGTLEDAKNQGTWAFRVFGSLFMAFGGAALFLATVGLYGVMSFAVAKRTQEIGVRMAMGASGSDVLRLVMHQGVWQVVLGLTIGLGLAFALASAMTALLFGVTASEPFMYVVVAAALGATGLMACAIPARRAARVDPMVALRVQ
jgi:predicted permease